MKILGFYLTFTWTFVKYLTFTWLTWPVDTLKFLADSKTFGDEFFGISKGEKLEMYVKQVAMHEHLFVDDMSRFEPHAFHKYLKNGLKGKEFSEKLPHLWIRNFKKRVSKNILRLSLDLIPQGENSRLLSWQASIQRIIHFSLFCPLSTVTQPLLKINTDCVLCTPKFTSLSFSSFCDWTKPRQSHFG